MSRPAKYSGAPKISPVFTLLPYRFLENEVVNAPPAGLPRPRKVKQEPQIPPLIKVRTNVFPDLGEEEFLNTDLPGMNVDVWKSLRQAMPGLDQTPAPFMHQPREKTRRGPKEFPEGSCVSDPSAMSSVAAGDVIQCVYFRGNQSSSVVSSLAQLLSSGKLWSSLQRFSSLRTLVLSGVGLAKLEELHLPSLRTLDITDNAINKESSVLKFCSRLVALQDLDFRGNPLKDILSLIEKLVGNLSCIETINGVEVELDARVKAVEAHSKRGKLLSPTVRWEWTVFSLAGVAESPTWEPQNITKLILPKSGLNCFHVKAFVNLELLDLSQNAITNLIDSGISYCEHLRVCDLRKNLVAKRDQLAAFQFNSSLRQLYLADNEVCKVKDYRPFVIFSTRACRGSNTTTGLLELDGVLVTLEERVTAFQLCASSKQQTETETIRWLLNAYEYYGRTQFCRGAGCARYCILPSRSLSVADLSTLTKLRVLDLSRNQLVSVPGLEKLSQLIFVDLSNNPKLNFPAVLSQLETGCTQLQQVLFYVSDVKGHARSDPSKSSYRMQVLGALLMPNPKLNYVDEILVNPNERVDTYARSGATTQDVEQYRFRLAVALQVMRLPRVLHPSALDPEKKPFNAENVLYLTNLSGFSLVYTNLASFVSLKELCLRDNKISDIGAMGLENLINLTKLDVANNNIKANLNVLAFFLDKLAKLSVLALSGNPCMKTAEDRMKLIGSMESMRHESPHLRVVDTVLTIRERMDALLFSGTMIAEAVEELRFKSVAVLCIPIGVPADQVTRLDFGFAGLKAVDFTKYPNLTVLMLRGNSIKTVSSIVGLNALKKLQLLDLRDNLLSNLNEVVRLLEVDLLLLETLGLCGNKLRKDYRAQVLVQLKKLHLQQCALHVIDDEPITPAELYVAAQASGTTKMVKDLQQFRFDLAFIQRAPNVRSRDLMVELDLSGSGLESVNLSAFISLRRLSLANNALSSSALEASSLSKLTTLVYLDLSKNKMKTAERVLAVLNPLKGLIALDVSDNPCFSGFSPVDVGKKLAHLKDATAPLVFLNGAELTVHQRCEIASYLQCEELDLFRLTFCAFQRGATEEVESLSLADCGLQTLGGLQVFTRLCALDLSGNGMSRFERHVFAYMPRLQFLDLRDNKIECTLDELVESLKGCQALTVLNILRSLAGEVTSRRNEYLVRVFEGLPPCQKLDGHKRSLAFGGGSRSEKNDSELSYRPSAGIASRRASVAVRTTSGEVKRSGGGGKKKSHRKISKDSRKGSSVDVREVRSAASSPIVPRNAASPIVPRIPAIGDLSTQQQDDVPVSPVSPGVSSSRSSSGGRRVKKPESPNAISRLKGGKGSPKQSELATSLPDLEKVTSSKSLRNKSSGVEAAASSEGPSPLESPSLARAKGSSRRISRTSRGSKVASSRLSLRESSPPDVGGGGAGGTLGFPAPPPMTVRPSMSSSWKDDASAPEDDDVDDVDDRTKQAISNATQLLRSLDFGSPTSPKSPKSKTSDDEYAESDEAEWKDLSLDEEDGDDNYDDKGVRDDPMEEKKRTLDPMALLEELQMFQVGEAEVEYEEEEEEQPTPPDDSQQQDGSFKDKFDLGAARGSGSLRFTKK